MKKIFLLPVLLMVLVAFPGCLKNKECTPVPPSAEVSQILAFAAANSMSVLPHSSGLYFEILSSGSGTTATDNSKIFITYVGKTMDGQIFDQQTSVNLEGWPLSGLIDGWRIGIPLIQKGGRIKLLIPSALAYQCKPYGALPANSVLYFDINLVDIQ